MAEEKNRIAIGVEYEGTAYKGFQKQESTTKTVQGCIDKALSKVADHKIYTICSGRSHRSRNHSFSFCNWKN